MVTQPLEYRRCKYAVEKLTEKAEERGLYYTKRPTNIDGSADAEKSLKRGQVKKTDLVRAMQKTLERKKSSQKVEKTTMPGDIMIEE